jgi:hypothetical protein
MIPLVGRVVRIAGGQFAPDDMGGGWGVQGMGGRPHPGPGHPTQRAWPNQGVQAAL